MFLMNKNVFITLKKLAIGFLIFAINYFKCSVVNFPYFVNCSFTGKHPNQWGIVKVAMYESISKDLSFLYC